MSKVIHHVNALTDIIIHDQHQGSDWVLEVIDSTNGSQLETFLRQRVEIGVIAASGGGFNVSVEVMSTTAPDNYLAHWEQNDPKESISYSVVEVGHPGGDVVALKIVGTDDLIFFLKLHDNGSPAKEFLAGLLVDETTGGVFKHMIGHR